MHFKFDKDKEGPRLETKWDKKKMRKINPEKNFNFRVFSQRKKSPGLQNKRKQYESEEIRENGKLRKIQRCKENVGASKVQEKYKNVKKSKQMQDTDYNRYSVLKVEECADIFDTAEERIENENQETCNPVVSFSIKSKKRKGTKKINKSVRKPGKILKLESSGDKFPQVSRCEKCFLSHFPHKKFCRWKTLVDKKPLHKLVEKATLLDETTVYLILSRIVYLETIENSKVFR